VFILENWCNSHNTKKDKIWVVVYMGGKKPPPLGYHRVPMGYHMGYLYMGWWNMVVQRQKAEKNLV